MVDGPTDDKDKGKIITFPGRKKLDSEGYIIGQVGEIPTPELLDPAVVDKDVKDRIEFVKNQDLVKILLNKGSIIDTINVVLFEIAEELSHLKYERRKAAKEGKNTSNYTIGRVSALKNLAELLLKKKEAIMQEEMDLKSPRFQAVFKVWMEFFHESMTKVGVSYEEIDLVFQQMKADMIDWEKKMSNAGLDNL